MFFVETSNQQETLLTGLILFLVKLLTGLIIAGLFCLNFICGYNGYNGVYGCLLGHLNVLE